MAKYKTDAEAQQDLARQLQEKARQLKPIYDSTDPVIKKKADALKADIGKIQNQLMMTSGFGALGGGLASGVTSVLTGIPDLAITAYNALAKPKEPTRLLSERFQPGLESVSQEQAGLFGLGKGVGSSWGMGKGLSALNIGTNVTDELVFNGTPVTQLLSAAGLLTTAGVKGIQNWRENRGVKKILEQLGPDGENTLRQFMLKGQDSSDPRIAGLVAQLRNDPKYANLFNILEKKATEAATAGARATTKAGYNAEEAGKGIFQAVDANISGLKEQIKTAGSGAYKKAFEMAGDTPMVSVTNTKDAIDNLIKQYSTSKLSDSESTVKFLTGLKNTLTEGEGLTSGVTNTVQVNKMTIPQLQAWLTDFGKKAAGNESLITDVSVGTQQKVAAAIFGSLKDDLKVLAQSNNVDERAVGNLMIGASKKTKQAVDNYQAAIAQGLPEILKNKNIASIDTDTLMNTISGLSAKQQKDLFGILKNTAPEDLKRIQQVQYDNFVQSARTTLPDGTTGVSLQELATKFNTLPTAEKNKLALSLGTSLEDFTGRMKDAENFFKYQQKFAGTEKAGLINPATVSEAAYAATGGQYAPSKVAGVGTRLYNEIKGGLSDDKVLNLLMSPETKGILREAVTNPNDIKTLDKISRALGQRSTEAERFGATRLGVQGTAQTLEPQTTTEEPVLNLEGINLEGINIPPEQAPVLNLEGIDLSYNPADIETKIRAEAQKQGLGQYADLFVKQAKAESGLNPYAVSPKGASGIFQHMPATAQELGIDPFDVTQSISGGVKYMGQLLNQYKDTTTALAAYNWGMGNVNRQGLENMPAETRDYIAKILG